MRLILYMNYYYLIDKFQGLVKLFANNSSANMKLSKTQLSKLVQLGRFVSSLDPFGIMRLEKPMKGIAKSFVEEANQNEILTKLKKKTSQNFF